MPENYFARYLPLLIQLGLVCVIAGGMIALSAMLGKRRYSKAKFTQYECGITPTGDARGRFSVKFYLVAMLFILFDVEAVFLIPWAVVYQDLVSMFGVTFGFGEMIVYLVIILVGFLYIWKKGVLDWMKAEGNL